MMIDVPAIHAPVALPAPEILEQVRRRRNRSNSTTQEQPQQAQPAPSRFWTNSAIFMGAVVLLNDGTECRIYQIEPNGTDFYCMPLAYE